MKSIFRPAVDSMAGYVPGEQPQESGWIKLNTNENPYPPSPRVVDAIRRAAEGRLNVYPDPGARSFRTAAASLFQVDPDWILPANGSDENLTIITRTFCDSSETVAYPYPSYVLYESLAEIQGARVVRLPLDDDWQWDPKTAADLRRDTRVFFIPNPNSPTGNLWKSEQLQQLVPDRGVLVLDEAYGDFCAQPHRGELLHRSEFDRRMIVTRTLSKSYSLAGLRFGFAVAHPDLISGMRKVKDSYNCDTLSIAAATAAIEDQSWMIQIRDRIIATRERMAVGLGSAGFNVTPSETNFLWVTHPSLQHQWIYEELKKRKILVRFMRFPHRQLNGRVFDGLRITVGTDPEADALLQAVLTIVPRIPAGSVDSPS